jgi:hypothetical protein
VFLVNSRLTHFTATGSILSCAQNGEAPITKFQASKKLQSFKLQTVFGEAALCLGFGAWDLELPAHFAPAQNGAGTPSSEVTGLDCRVP